MPQLLDRTTEERIELLAMTVYGKQDGEMSRKQLINVIATVDGGNADENNNAANGTYTACYAKGGVPKVAHLPRLSKGGSRQNIQSIVDQAIAKAAEQDD